MCPAASLHIPKAFVNFTAVIRTRVTATAGIGGSTLGATIGRSQLGVCLRKGGAAATRHVLFFGSTHEILL